MASFQLKLACNWSEGISVASQCQLEFCKNLITFRRGGRRYSFNYVEAKAPPFGNRGVGHPLAVIELGPMLWNACCRGHYKRKARAKAARSRKRDRPLQSQRPGQRRPPEGGRYKLKTPGRRFSASAYSAGAGC